MKTSSKQIEYIKKWQQKNRERTRLTSRKWYAKNKEYDNERCKLFRKNNPKYSNNWYRKKLKTDIQLRLKYNLRIRLNRALKNNQKVGSAVDLLGCSISEFKKHLESKFSKGMNWDNYSRDGWHIDHIKPLSSFDLTEIKQLTEACNYKNLQSLWAKDNYAKNSKLI